MPRNLRKTEKLGSREITKFWFPLFEKLQADAPKTANSREYVWPVFQVDGAGWDYDEA
jgi:hypothetical protein